MDHHRERHDRILQMREAGESLDEIVSALEISWQMEEVVRRMVRKFETEAILSARSSRFLEEILREGNCGGWKPVTGTGARLT